MTQCSFVSTSILRIQAIGSSKKLVYMRSRPCSLSSWHCRQTSNLTQRTVLRK